MSDPAFPQWHGRPPAGWLNDPNGLCRVDGRWHVFFQYNPHSPHHDRICWGHQSSDDLVHWRPEPLALEPGVDLPDRLGCWSGTFTLDEGRPTLCYTAMPGHAADAVALVARGDRGMSEWTVLPEPAAGRVGVPTAETRDPFVFVLDGRRFVVQGHGGPATPAALLVYDASDMEHWEPLGPLLGIEDPVAAQVAPADIWECPNLVQVDGQWVLVISLWQHDGTRGVLAGVRWLVGGLELVDSCPRFTPTDGGVLDEGPAFYAPQALVDQGRVLLWGWSWELERDEEWLARHGWAGVLTTPRELHLADGRLVSRLPQEVLAARGQAVDVTRQGWPAATGAVIVTTTGAGRLVCSEPEGMDSVKLPEACTVIIDGSLVEVLWQANSHTTRIYPTQGSHWRVDGGGLVQVHRLH